MKNTIASKLASLKEVELTTQIIIPLVEKLHLGRIEYTHSAIEAGRDIISFGKDLLGREHVLCVQVKGSKISFAARKFGELFNTATTAKEQGVIRTDGGTILPHEVWIVTSGEFNAHQRGQVSDLLKKMTSSSIKILDIGDICSLLRKHLPDKYSFYSGIKDAEYTQLISELSIHKEGRAFGLSQDRYIEDFFVPVSLASRKEMATRALSGEFEVRDVVYTLSVPINELILKDEIDSDANELTARIKDRVRRDYLDRLPAVFSDFDVNLEINLKSSLSNSVKEYHTLIISYVNAKDIPADVLERDKLQIRFEITAKLHERFTRLLSETKDTIEMCPKELGEDVTQFILAERNLSDLDHFLAEAAELHNISRRPGRRNENEVIRVTVKNPANVMKLSRLLMLEGPPGHGKTTFLRVLAVNLLVKGKRVIFVPCSFIPAQRSKSNLHEIIRSTNQSSGGGRWPHKGCTLILDGLDEAPFDLSKKILKSSKDFHQIIVSSRTAFETDIRKHCFSVALAPFGESERDEFFRKWFSLNSNNLSLADNLISKYKDIDDLTRIPLVATITAALIENGYEPTTRAEIYGYRLDLLLSKWDRIKGVNRFRIPDPKAKRKFLQKLAYQVHCAKDRRRQFEQMDILSAYRSLGDWAYERKVDDLMYDLVVGSGVILDEGDGLFSFGHLTFQEHLVGEYLHTNKVAPDLIASRLTDDWWREPVLFYASLMGDVTDLINHFSKSQAIFGFTEVLMELLYCAPYTQPGAKELILGLRGDLRSEIENQPERDVDDQLDEEED